MAKLSVFNSVSLDGYFTDDGGDMSWAYAGADDPEWQTFVSGNAGEGDGALLFGRVTYEQMASYWPTPQAMEAMPTVAEGMNRRRKYVASTTITKPEWDNTTAIADLVAGVRRLKQGDGPDIVILGSGMVVAELAAAGLVDGYQFVVCPIALGSGRTLFDGVGTPITMKLVKSQAFRNGKVVNTYAAG